MENVQDGLGIKNMSDVWSNFKENMWHLWNKNLWKEQIKLYKMTERQIFEKYNNLSADELNTKSNKGVYVENDVMTTVIKHCRGEKKEAKEK